MEEPLVLLPGMNCSPRLWWGVADAVARRLPRLLVRYESPAADSVDRCVEELLRASPARFALCGLSLGGIVAMAVARRAPERVTRLCLMSTNPHEPTAEQRASWRVLRADLAAGRTARDVQRGLLPVLLSTAARTPPLEEQVLLMADETGSDLLDRQLAAQGTRVDERPALRRVAVPTLVLAAAQDALCPVRKHEEMHELIPGSRLVVLDGIGHLSPLEAPGAVAEQLTRWLEQPALR